MFNAQITTPQPPDSNFRRFYFTLDHERTFKTQCVHSTGFMSATTQIKIL